MGALYRVFGARQLSAGYRYTTILRVPLEGDHRAPQEDERPLHSMPTARGAVTAQAHRHHHRYAGHTPCWPHALSRRQCAHTAAGVTVVGPTVSVGVGGPVLATGRGSNAPVPWSGGYQAGHPRHTRPAGGP